MLVRNGSANKEHPNITITKTFNDTNYNKIHRIEYRLYNQTLKRTSGNENKKQNHPLG